MTTAFPLKKAHKIRKHSEYMAFFKTGKRIHHGDFILLYAPLDTGPSRFGTTVSRRVGNAVVRNRIKRIIREWFRLSHASWPQPMRLNIIAKKKPDHLSFKWISPFLEKLVHQVGERRH